MSKNNAKPGTLGRDVVVFSTGGTISMHAGPDGGVAPDHGFVSISGQVGKYLKDTPLRFVDWADAPSPHMTPRLMWKLAMDVQAALEDDSVCGAVVLHGTDVMEETAYLLDLTVKSDKPVVFTGSMRSMDELGYDGLRNLVLAVKCCLKSPPGVGTVLQMSDRLYAAAEVIKVHSTAIGAFDSPGFGPIGAVTGDVLQMERWPVRGRVFTPEEPVFDVDLVTLCPGMDARHIECSMERGAVGLVVEGFGAGNVPPSVVDTLHNLVRDGVPIVLTSRCIQGGVWPIYGYRGGAAGLQRHGLILGGGLPGQKARIKLMVALGETRDMNAVRAAFERSTR